MNFIEEGNFYDTGREAELDAKKRITLGSVVAESPSNRYRVLKNELGQILLDPVKSIPANEAWIYENPEIIAAIRQGIKDAEEGRVFKLELPDDLGDHD